MLDITFEDLKIFNLPNLFWLSFISLVNIHRLLLPINFVFNRRCLWLGRKIYSCTSLTLYINGIKIPNMKKSELSNLSNEALIKKEKSTKALMALLIILSLALLGFAVYDYMRGNPVDNSTSIIILCTIGGFVSLFPELKKIKKEINNR